MENRRRSLVVSPSPRECDAFDSELSLREDGFRARPRTCDERAFSIIQRINDSITQEFDPLHPLTSKSKTSGISLHSSQNNNVVLFFVVRAARRNETNLSICNHLQADFQISTGLSVEICGP